MSLGNEVVWYREGGGSDDMGNPVDHGDPVKFEGCAVYPRGMSSEDSGRQVTAIEGYTVLIPGAAAIKRTGQIRWEKHPDVWYDVMGIPATWAWFSGEVAGTQVNIETAAA